MSHSPVTRKERGRKPKRRTLAIASQLLDVMAANPGVSIFALGQILRNEKFDRGEEFEELHIQLAVRILKARNLIQKIQGHTRSAIYIITKTA